MLPDEYYLLHPVSVVVVPVALKNRIAHHHYLQLIRGHSREPLSYVLKADLFTCLLEQITYIRVLGEITQSLGADYILRPAPCDEIIELVDIQGLAPVIDICTNSVLLDFPALMFMMMVVVMMFVLVVIIVIIVVMMVAAALRIIALLVIVMVMMVMMVIVLVFIVIVVIIVVMMVVMMLMLILVIVVMMVVVMLVIVMVALFLGQEINCHL